MDGELAFASAIRLRQLIADKQVSCPELVDLFLPENR